MLPIAFFEDCQYKVSKRVPYTDRSLKQDNYQYLLETLVRSLIKPYASQQESLCLFQSVDKVDTIDLQQGTKPNN